MAPVVEPQPDGTQSPPPAGAPRFVTFDGILEGRLGDDAAMSRATAALTELGVGEFQLERDGGRFSLLPDNTQQPGQRFSQAAQDRLLLLLREIAAAARGPIESTLRCTMVFDGECTETLFRAVAPPPSGPGIEPLTRRRPVRADDQPVVLPSRPPLRQLLGRREVTIVLPLLVLAFGLMAWRSGLLDRLLAASATGLRTDRGTFGELLAIDVQGHFGNYQVVLRRGSAYPVDSAAWDARIAAATGEQERLANIVVREGQEVHVQLRDASNAVLANSKVSLRPLVAGGDGEAKAELPGHFTASQVTLSIAEQR